MPEPGLGPLPIAELDREQLNEALRRIQAALDRITGEHGNFTRRRWTFRPDGIVYIDSNGQVLHGFGNI